jgi:adenylate cyclase
LLIENTFADESGLPSKTRREIIEKAASIAGYPLPSEAESDEPTGSVNRSEFGFTGPLTNVIGDTHKMNRANSAVLPITALVDSGYIGFVDSNPDSDGIRRRLLPLAVKIGTLVYPTISTQTLMQYWKIEPEDVTLRLGEYLAFRSPEGERKVPINERGEILINWRSPDEVYESSIGYSKLLELLDKDPGNGETWPEAVPRPEGKILVVGQVASGLTDIGPSPYHERTPKVLTHINVINSILREDYLRIPATWSCLVVWLLLAWSSLLASRALNVALAAGLPILMILLFVVTAFQLFFLRGVQIPMAWPILAFGSIHAGEGLRRWWLEQSSRQFLKKTFENYLAPDLIDEMVASKTMPTLGGEARIMTAYFSDLQGFTSLAEQLTASQLVELLNDYLSVMTELLLADKGTLDKYEGDAIIAFVGAPVEVPDHALRACRIALRMQDALTGLRGKWKSEKASPDEPDRNCKHLSPDLWRPEDKWPRIVHALQMRIGINSGEMVVGNMGSETRMNYTMIGDAVNLAARLETAAKQYGIFTLVSEFSLDCEFADETGKIVRVGEYFETRSIDEILVVGKSEPVGVHELLGEKGRLGESVRMLSRFFAEGRGLYRRMHWDEAIVKFEAADKFERFAGAHTTPSRVYIKRCIEFKKSPPANSADRWDGVYRFTKK